MADYCDSPATLRLEALDSHGIPVQTLDFMDAANGYRVSSLDVGFPTVRESVSARPTREGDYDVTSLYGPRAVTITGSLVPSTAGSRQKAMQALAYWCQPRLRPRLVYAYDTDCALQWLTLRGSSLSAPASNPAVSDFTVSWVAPNPVAKALSPSTVTIAPGATGSVTNGGTYRAWPVFEIHGPCTDPRVDWVSPAQGAVVFGSTPEHPPHLVIASGDYVEVDTDAQTALPNGNTDPAVSLYGYLDFHQTRWPDLEPGTTGAQFTATSPGTGCQLVVNWADATI